MEPSPKLKQQLNAEERVLWYGRPLKTPFLMGTLEFVSIGIAAILILAYVAWTYGPTDMLVYGFVLSFGIPLAFLFLFYAPRRLLKGARETEYMVTNQRVFFETLSEYAFQEYASRMGGPEPVKVVNLGDVEDVYIKRGFHDRVFGTSTLYVLFRGFQRTTRSWGAEGEVILRHKPPSFPFIKEAALVGEIVREAAGKVQRKSLTLPPTSNFYAPPPQTGLPTASPMQKRSRLRHNPGLALGAALLLSGLLVLVYGYFSGYTPYESYENGYTYINYVALFAAVFFMSGMLVLFLSFRKWALGLVTSGRRR